MKRVFIYIVFFLGIAVLHAQERKDSVVNNEAEQERPSNIHSNPSIKDGGDGMLIIKLQKEIDSLRTSNSKLTDSLNGVEKEKEQVQKENKQLRDVLLNADESLANIASNFLYIPYEAYSIENIAIPAYKAIYNEKEKNKYRNKNELLLHYQEDARTFLAFLKKVEKKLAGGFPNADDAKKAMEELDASPYYRRYQLYSDYRNTYLGKFFVEVKTQLKQFDGTVHKVNFTEMIRSLNSCLKTVEDL